jgi:hypothetical protein
MPSHEQKLRNLMIPAKNNAEIYTTWAVLDGILDAG